MLRVKHFIITYKNEGMVLNNLNAIYKADIPNNIDYSITVINNYGTLTLPKEFGNVNVINNALRLDSSTGHLSRNWNQCILLGFQSLLAPDADIVILSQDDVELFSNFLTVLIRGHSQYDLIAQGIGDSFHSYTARAIKRVGLWDERFCNIGYQDYDFFYRSLKFNYQHTSINLLCSQHLRKNPALQYNATITPVVNPNVLCGFARRDPHHLASEQYHQINRALLSKKYGLGNTNPETIFIDLFSKNHDIKIDSYLLYPYFEKDIDREVLVKQRYYI
jgi:hypothetical protein